MSISNSEKQARFRRKEALKRGAEQVFRDWNSNVMGSSIPPEEVLNLLQKASELPAGWMDEDYVLAVNKLEQLRLDLLTNGHDLSNDVHVAYSTEPDTGRVRLKPGAVDMARRDVEAGHELARHLISAIQLSKCGEVATTAAIMEVVRHVARDLVVSAEIPRSSATTACLLALPQYLDRPKWFVGEVTNMLRNRLGDDLCSQIGSKLSNNVRES